MVRPLTNLCLGLKLGHLEIYLEYSVLCNKACYNEAFTDV
jgi:hypothetical protein